MAAQLAKRFHQVIGVDPSPSMIKVAQQEQQLSNVTFCQAYGEALPVDDLSVDLITVAQSLHWLDPAQFLGEVKRVLRPNGTLVAWGYMFGKMLGNEDCLAELGEGALGQFWEPNRAIATAGFVSWLPAFQATFKDVQHMSYPDPLLPCSKVLAVPWMDDSEMTLDQLVDYVKTWSSYKNWLDGNAGKDDVVDAFFKQRCPSLTGDSLVHVQWPHSVFIASQPLD